MNTLNLEMVNSHSEYPVFLSQTGKYVFKTDFDILYAVDFELDSYFNFNHEFNLIIIIKKIKFQLG